MTLESPRVIQNEKLEKDQKCGALSLDQNGKKEIAGSGEVLNCWQ